MRDTLAAIAPYLQNDAFYALISGVAAPFLHWLLRELGMTLSPRKNFAMNVLLSATPFLALATFLGANGLPDPDMTFALIFAAVGVSQSIYKGLVEKMQDGRATEVTVPRTA